jgi:diguanylate cyclase (GGDEF)-like protein
MLLLNLRGKFYFFISDPGNIRMQGTSYIILPILSYTPVLFTALDIISSFKVFRRQFYLILLFLLFCGTGSVIDLIRHTSIHFYVFYSAAMLYAYFFIVRTDAGIDPLTGIGNRYSFNEFIDKLSRRSTKESYAIVMIDMDHFKEINDTLGHAEGDNALRDMAAIIKSCIRHSDFAARYGGDEFVLVVSAEYDIKRLMDRIQQTIDFQNEKHVRPYQIEMSYGCDVFTTNSDQLIQEFLAHVDRLMYKNKQEKKLAAARAET